MFIIGSVLVFILYMLLKALITDMDTQDFHSLRNDSNITLSNLISDSVINSWLADPHLIDNEIANKNFLIKNTSDNNSKTFNPVVLSSDGDDNPNTTLYKVQKDDSISSKDYFLESLFEPPTGNVVPDWSVVLGTFSHYDDDNWKEFLIQTEVPVFIRMFLSDSSETVTISRKSVNGKMSAKGQDYEISVDTASWLITHTTKFQIGIPFKEMDFDATDSLNTFFFTSPRLLIHNKLKDNWRAAIIRHFDEKGLNMTFVDRERLVVARRFFRRV